MTSHPIPSEPVPPADGTGHDRPEAVGRETSDGLSPAAIRSPLRAFRDWLRTRRTASHATPAAHREPADRRTRSEPITQAGLFHPGEIEYAHVRSQPPFDTDRLILTDLRIMRVRTDAAGAVLQVSQAAPWQVMSAQAETIRDRTTVTVELHVGSSMRLEETTPTEAQRFVDTLTEVVARSRT
ncbi:hypothetical protein [Brevibacterium spongiae]|uniref:YokE-like PH domain-containing protein n=1 Tax=Brevibacterium spongiae TaxID=2909672 RepID=A0ABY5STL0_9MICO|nr:hypothetical protein [Brevibacterium spongiae]UVI36483.1 hypothetical protein L1F31_02115 [Brevibacterium spongiae]